MKTPSLLQEAKARRQKALSSLMVSSSMSGAEQLLTTIAYTELDKLEAIARLHDALSPIENEA